jgi:cytochrome c5
MRPTGNQVELRLPINLLESLIRMKLHALTIAILTLAACGMFNAMLRSQTANPQPSPAAASDQPSVWDGVYSDEQAKRGESLYSRECSFCHGDKLKGSDSTPPLTGNDFAADWDGRTLGDLFKKIRLTMPQGEPDRLKPQQDADVLAFILSFNKFPSGKAELAAETEPLKRIRFLSAKPDPK